jgi:hypothetical protein
MEDITMHAAFMLKFDILKTDTSIPLYLLPGEVRQPVLVHGVGIGPLLVRQGPVPEGTFQIPHCQPRVLVKPFQQRLCRPQGHLQVSAGIHC